MDLVASRDLVQLQKSSIPEKVCSSVSVIVYEFAGVKFKITGETGKQYLRQIDCRLGRILKECPNTKEIVVCEEKYSFTPDGMKASTREKRQKVGGIGHLKTPEAIISLEKMDKKAIKESAWGRKVISTFLADHVAYLTLSSNVKVIIDSELRLENECACGEEKCTCASYSNPKQTIFKEDGTKKVGFLDIKQRKGEAEMAQFDWVATAISTLEPGQSVLSIVTSGDVDAVIIHLFSLAKHIHESQMKSLEKNVYVVLEKAAQGSFDIYNMREIIETIERRHGVGSSMLIATVLMMGGNDFVPKMHGVTHSAFLDTVLREELLDKIVVISHENSKIDEDTFLNLIKTIYCPKSFPANLLSIQEVRQISVKNPAMKDFNPPQKWMPPLDALKEVLCIMQWNLMYLLTAGDHSAVLPPMPNCTLFCKYSEGQDGKWKVERAEDLLVIPEKDLPQRHNPGKRQKSGTPQKGCRRKIQLTSTPVSRPYFCFRFVVFFYCIKVN